MHCIADKNDEVYAYNFLYNNANLPYDKVDRQYRSADDNIDNNIEGAKKILLKVALKHLMRMDTDASSRPRSKRIRFLDFRQSGRGLRNKEHYSLLMSQLEPFFDHVRSLDTRGFDTLKTIINSENNKRSIYHQFFNRVPLYRLQIETLQDSNSWMKHVE